MKAISTKNYKQSQRSFGIQSYPFAEKKMYYTELLRKHGPQGLLTVLKDAREAEDRQSEIEQAGGRGVDKDYSWRRDDTLTIAQVLIDNGVTIPPRENG